MKSLLYGVALIIVLGVGGFLYRNAVEHPARPLVCPVSVRTCPDGSSVAHLVTSCEFPACPLPNVLLGEGGIAFAIPAGFEAREAPDSASIAAYVGTTATTSGDMIIVRRFAVGASSTALATIRETAISETSGEPVPITAFTSALIGRANFTRVTLERFEGVVTTAYYLSRGRDVLRFDAVDHEVPNWTSPTLDQNALPAHQALRTLLSTLEAGSAVY